MAIHTPNDSPDMRGPIPDRSQAGFTMIEMVVSMMIMTIGLLSLASAIAFALTVSNKGRSVTNTKLLISTVIEQMETLRNTRQLGFGQISNVGQVDNTGASNAFAGFSSGFTYVSINPGPDGIYGTQDDMVDAGPDGIYGTQDDFTNPALARPGYSRRILITSLSPHLKKIEVTLKFPDGTGRIESMVGIGYLNNDSNGNFIY